MPEDQQFRPTRTCIKEFFGLVAYLRNTTSCPWLTPPFQWPFHFDASVGCDPHGVRQCMLSKGMHPVDVTFVIGHEQTFLFTIAPQTTTMNYRYTFLAVFISANCAVALCQNGILDPTFGNNGVAAVPPELAHNSFTDVLVQPDGKVLCSGFVSNGAFPNQEADFLVVRYMADGTPDASFNGSVNGLLAIGTPADAETAIAVALQSDNKILVAGGAVSQTNGSSNGKVVRLLPDGTLDNEFGVAGTVVLDGLEIGSGPGSIDYLQDMVVLPSGKILVTGFTNLMNSNRIFLLQLNSNGTLDNGFGTGGVANSMIGDEAYANSMTVQADGRILLAGSRSYQGGSALKPALVRFMPDGTLDNSFGSGGTVLSLFGLPASGGYFTAAEVLPDGKIIATGEMGATPIVARFSDIGELDGSFGFSGATFAPFSSWQSWEDLILLPDGKILISSTMNSTDMALVRLLETGLIDDSFGGDGVVNIPTGNTGSESPRAIAWQTDGKILVCGGKEINGESSSRVYRLFGEISVGLADLASPVTSVVIRPNPAQNSAVVEFSTTKTGVVSVELRDALGKLVAVPMGSSIRSAGEHRTSLDLSNVGAGLYLVTIKTPENNSVIRIMKE